VRAFWYMQKKAYSSHLDFRARQKVHALDTRFMGVGGLGCCSSAMPVDTQVELWFGFGRNRCLRVLAIERVGLCLFHRSRNQESEISAEQRRASRPTYLLKGEAIAGEIFEHTTEKRALCLPGPTCRRSQPWCAWLAPCMAPSSRSASVPN
jgi:hypothetical protein